MAKTTWRATATLVGTIIGAGIFGIPYVMAKIGFLPGMVYLFVLGLLLLLLNLIYGEVILRTPGDHQLTGYGEIYLGKTGKFLATLSLFIALYGALLAYLIKMGDFIGLILNIQRPVLFSSIFFFGAAAAIFFGLKLVSFFEVFLVASRLFLILLIVGFGLTVLKWENFLSLDFSHSFLPFGVMLFAFAGFSVIPEVEEILRREPKKLKKSIFMGSFIPILAYFLFSFSVVGVSGLLTSDDAISGLAPFLPSLVVKLGGLLGVLNLAGAFLTLGFVLKEVWFRDFKFSKTTSFLLACLPSFLAFLLGARKFIEVLAISGALSGGLSGILILAIFEKAQKQGKREPVFSLSLPKGLLGLLYFIFLLAMLSPLLEKLRIL